MEVSLNSCGGPTVDGSSVDHLGCARSGNSLPILQRLSPHIYGETWLVSRCRSVHSVPVAYQFFTALFQQPRASGSQFPGYRCRTSACRPLHANMVKVSNLPFLPIRRAEHDLQSRVCHRVYKRSAAKHGGHAPPEARLIMGMAGAIGE
jgi:hypothetical protein